MLNPVQKILKKALIEAQDDRALRPNFWGDRMEWNVYEMLVMYGEVNRMRQEDFKDTISFEEIEDAERLASGHIDYTPKFALYCAELVKK